MPTERKQCGSVGRSAPGAQARSRSGFVLAELAIAIGVATAAFVGVFALAHQSLRIADDMKSELCAAQAAESEMERLRAMPWSRLAAMGSSFALDTTATPALTELRDGSGTVRVLPAGGEATKEGIRAVSVRITWAGRDGRRKELAFATLMTARGEERR